MRARSLLLMASAFAAAGVLGAPLSAQGGPRSDGADPLPLETTRTLRYTVDRGSWMSVDVHPDGRTLVFDLLGDLYTLPLEGGRATPLLTGEAFEAMPRFSPDGERILFVSDRSGGHNLWILERDGSDTTRVTRGNDHLYTSPEWAPDGRYVVASRTYSPLGGSAKLWLFHVDGGSGAALIEEPNDLKTMGAAFGPDPRYLYYAQREGDWQYGGTLPQYQVAVYDRETGESTTLTGRQGSAFRPALSPDGRWLVYGTRHDADTGLRIRDMESGEERWLAYPVQRDDQESRATLGVLPGYAFTPDGREVVATWDGRLWRVPVAEGAGGPVEIPFTVDVELHAGPRLDFDYPIPDDPTFLARQVRHLVPSPDGRRVAFTALNRLYVADHPGGEPRRLAADVPGGAFHPAWSPDGRTLAFVSWEDRTGGHLWSVPAAGGQPRRLTSVSASYAEPAWTPGGDRVVALRAAARTRREGGPSGAELVWLPASGGELTTVAPAAGREHPHFRAEDPDRIWLHGDDGLVSIRWDGTDVREHLRVTGYPRASGGEPGDADLLLRAPRGEMALAVVDDDVFVMPVPTIGGETPTVDVRSPDRAIVPVRKLSELGAWWPAWGADGRTVHFTLGNSHFVYDLDRAEAVEDSLEAAAAADEDEDEDEDEEEDEDGDDEEPAYRAAEHRIEIAVPRDLPRGVMAFVGGRVVTMNGDEVLEDGVVVVRDRRIEAVGRRGEVTVPEGAEVVDATGRTLVPGFVDTHAHMRPERDIHTTQPWEYLANLAYGVTTTRDPQTSSTDVLTYADRVRAGEVLGPRIFSTGPGVFGSYGGQEPIRSLDHARDLLRRYSEYFDTKTFKMYLAGNRQQRQWLVMAARELGLMPATEAGLDIFLDLTHAMDGYPAIEHNLPVTPLYEDVVELFARTKVVNTPTLIVTFGGPRGEDWWYMTTDVHGDEKLLRWTPHHEVDARTRRRGGGRSAGFFLEEEHVFDDHAAFLADVVEAGGYAGVGGHGQLQGLGWHWELWMLQSGGMSAHDALRSATIFGANGIGLEGEIGSIEPGKLADIVVLDRNPLEDIRNSTSVRQVMLNGRLYDADTLDEVWPRRRALDFRGFVEDVPEASR